MEPIAVESAAELDLVNGKAQVAARFDEYNLDVDIVYDGVLPDFPSERPTAKLLFEDDAAFTTLSCYLIRQYTDRIKSTAEDRCHIQLHFDH